jgi:uncharacterized membrane protein
MTTTSGLATALAEAIRWGAISLEAVGAFVVVIGSAAALLTLAVSIRTAGGLAAWRRGRELIGRSLLLGLEFVVAADLLKSLVIDPDLEALVFLGGLILVRTALMISLSVEINGRWPWQQTMRSGTE